MWQPTTDFIKKTNLYKIMQQQGFETYQDFYNWSITDRKAFWDTTVKALDIKLDKDYSTVLDDTNLENPVWLKDAKLNIVSSCFQANGQQPAIIYQNELDNHLKSLTYNELETYINQIANGLYEAGLSKGDTIGIDMSMNIEAVAIYLAGVKAGMQVITVADSFSPNEIKVRFDIVPPKLVFTQDYLIRNNKKLALYDKVLEAGAEKVVVIPHKTDSDIRVRRQDMFWDDFLSDNTVFESIPANPLDTTTVLFSSGTTGNPKAIPWNHTTAIKSAADGFYHHDIQEGNVVAWPTNLGWMMGPWLIYATMINKGTIALFEGSPMSEQFGAFIQNAKVNMLGVVPSIVRAWKQAGTMEPYDWSAVKCFSSTGESSNPEDMTYLMQLADNKPIIEYCGGTEIGGGYVTSTLIQTNIPSTFSTPALGSEFVIVDENQQLSDRGEVFLVPPAMGLSFKLLNKNHHQVYYENTPKINGKLLRRHGDYLVRMPNGYYRVMGRTDDSMNLGGIKVSSLQIEELVNSHMAVNESAAIAVTPEKGGPALLVIYLVPNGFVDKELIHYELQKLIKQKLNPLFKIHDVVVTDKLPRTASNKIMRRLLRDDYQQKSKHDL
jgi:acetyl-CoA synthetase